MFPQQLVEFYLAERQRAAAASLTFEGMILEQPTQSLLRIRSARLLRNIASFLDPYPSRPARHGVIPSSC